MDPTLPKNKRTRAMRPVTARQQAVLEFLQGYFRLNGYWPSIREILDFFGFKSTNAVQRHLQALEHKGCIKRSRGQARAFSFVGNPTREASAPGTASIIPFSDDVLPPGALPVVDIPIYGNIAAGYPDRVESAGTIGRLQIDMASAGIRRRGSPSTAFALKVRGDSMVDAGIFEGDIVIVEPGEGAHGDIVAALIDGETTLKRLIIERGQSPYLKAENQKYPELYPLNELQVQGIARSVVRSL